MVAHYDIHPSLELCRLFSDLPIPFQGQDPTCASVIFVGLDANYAPEIFDAGDFRKRIIEYHQDGIAFWQRHGVHHPFLHSEYPLPGLQGGKRYHRMFSKMELTPDFAPKISFVELLNVPTTGSTDDKRFWELFSLDHAKNLDDLFNDGERRLVLLPRSVIAKMGIARKRFGVFKWLPKKGGRGLIGRVGQSEFHQIKHFFASISNIEIQSIGDLVRQHCA